MVNDLQRASMWKRISAFIFDAILLAIVVIGLASLFSFALKYDSYVDRFDDICEIYEEQYAVEFDITQDEYNAMSDEDKMNYDTAFKALSSDLEANRSYSLMISLTLVITSISILLGYIALELIVPLVLKNGQTLGKKIFGIALMRTDGVKISTFALFVRTILGKYTLETMIPVLILIMIYFNSVGLMGIVVLGLIALLQLILVLTSRSRNAIHDLIACTVVVDYASQMIFDSTEALVEYKKKIHAENTLHAER